MSDREWAREIAEKIKEKVKVVTRRNRHKIPYTAKDGVFDDWGGKDVGWWTNGFWGGIMWQLYHATGERLYKEIAEENEEKLDANLTQSARMDHDSGFRWLPTAVANYRLTGNAQSRNRGLLAADNLAGRFNPAGRFIRAWNDNGDGSKAGWAIIDCMMNLPLLYWAYGELKDPRYLHIATMHGDTAAKYFIREDGSSRHIVEFNPVSGEYVKSYGGQGYAEGSSWARGQAWALYGFALSYLHTKRDCYLDAAKALAGYFIANLPENGLIPVDFRQPKDCGLEDSTAAAIAACGLLQLEGLIGLADDEDSADSAGDKDNADSVVNEDTADTADSANNADKKKYHDAAVKLLRVLNEHRCNWDRQCDNILEKCTAAFHDTNHEFPIIYGDYFFVEGIWKLTGEELFIW
jgi:unsaturated chondroitin disaccharide hydrolase